VHVTVPPTPGLKLTKSATLTTDGNGNGKADKGDVITYSFKVENTGTVDMTGVSINDPMVTSTTPASADIAAGADTTFTATYTVKQGDVDAGGQIHNSAKATGTWNDAGTPTSFDSNTSTADIAVAAADPKLDLSKTATLTTDNGTVGKADKDDVITYTITASNDGNVTLTDVSVTDPMTGLSAIAPASVATLAPGDDATFTATYTVTQDDVDAGDDILNSATGHAKDPAGGAVTSALATAKTPVIAVDPDVSITKSAALTTDNFEVGKADAGDVITYTFTAHNGGLATAHDVSVSDPLAGLSAITPASVADLAPGADAVFTATYTVTRADVVAGKVDNTATVSSTGPTRGGVAPTPVTADSNTVTVEAARLGTPKITTTTRTKVTAKVKKSGAMRPVGLSDKVTISGLRTGSTATGTAVLYGPTSHRTSGACVSGKVVKSLSFTPHNGTFRTASVKVRQPGHYTWVVSTGADALNEAATHGCGLKSETTLVHRKGYGKIRIETGFDGVTPTGSFFARMIARPQVSIKAIGMKATLDTVGIKHGSMVIPENVSRAGWLSRSAAPGDTVGATVIAGHVSNYYDRPGAFGKLKKAKKGQKVTVRGADGAVHKYKIVRIHRQNRGKGFAGVYTSTTGAPKLVLVTCTDEVHYTNGHFHYRKNLVVVAVPIK
jgi:LPXTG-site transpeptidase (sortase) family protein